MNITCRRTAGYVEVVVVLIKRKVLFVSVESLQTVVRWLCALSSNVNIVSDSHPFSRDAKALRSGALMSHENVYWSITIRSREYVDNNSQPVSVTSTLSISRAPRRSSFKYTGGSTVMTIPARSV